ncbi:unnamed protein product, partial [Thlaspi arvense]
EFWIHQFVNIPIPLITLQGLPTRLLDETTTLRARAYPSFPIFFPLRSSFVSGEIVPPASTEDIDRSYSLHYAFYQESCPSAERLVVQFIHWRLGGRTEQWPLQASLSVILACFASIGFNKTFFEDRLYNSSGTGKPGPELNPLTLVY